VNTDWGIISANLSAPLLKTNDERKMANHVHDYKDSADDNTLNASTQDWVCDDRKGLVYDHVGEQERN
jgi:hypothetical protein